ncbi:MAG: hypothetical protein KDK41_17170 [Leptospiraceae bacterium]|nr:hypothetical protein [Leptospiraceae bacterium]
MSECIKQINDDSYQWSVREYKQIFFLCEYINAVAIEIKECHLYQVAALKLSQEINNAPRQQRQANKALKATNWSRALDFAINIDYVKPTKHNDQGWGLAQRYCADRMKASKQGNWIPAVHRFIYHAESLKNNDLI